MAKRIATFACNTNLAAEYYVMSLLSRAGKEAYLSLGNKKGVDIIVQTGRVSICLIEVKGVNQNNDWLIGNTGRFLQSPALFYALQCFNGKMTSYPFLRYPGYPFCTIRESNRTRNCKESKNGVIVEQTYP